MSKSTEEYFEIDLLKLLQTFWRHIWIIIISAVVFGAATFGVTRFVIPPKYESDVLIYVNNSSFSLGSTSFSISSSELSAAQSLVDTYLVILQSRSVLTEIINTAGLAYNIDQLRDMITAAPVNNTEVFRITVESTSPTESELIANTIVDILPNKISDIVDGSSVRIVDYAVADYKATSPSVYKNSVIAAFLGIALACIVITVKELSDTVIHDEEYLLSNYDIPILSVIPDLNKTPSGSSYTYSA